MNLDLNIAVCSRSFSRDKVLRNELLSRYKRVKFNDAGLTLSGNTLVEFLEGADCAIIGLERLDQEVLLQLPTLKVISKYGVGLDSMDLNCMMSLKICLGWSPGVNRRSVSELVIAFAINSLRNLNYANNQVKSGGWKQVIGDQLTGKNFGIVGCGRIGKDLVKLLIPFECKILVNDICMYPEFYRENNIVPLGLDELLKQSDIVSLHLPLNTDTKNILSAELMALMKPTSVLINVARGGLVDEIALERMLSEGLLKAAAFDVFSNEPPENNNLLKMDNFYATPHIGGSSSQAIIAMGMAAIDGLKDNFYITDRFIKDYQK